MSYMVDIFNRLGMPGGLNATLPAPMPAETAAPQQAMSGLMNNFAPPAPQPPNPQGAMGNLMSNFPQPAPQGLPNLQPSWEIPSPSTKEEQFLVQCGVPPQTAKQICGTGMQQPTGFGGGGLNTIEAPMGGNGRIGQRTANGDTGLQGANMPPQGGPMQYGQPQQMPAFQPPQPMPFMPQQQMPGMQPYNFSQQMGQTAPPSPMTGQMKGMFGVR